MAFIVPKHKISHSLQRSNGDRFACGSMATAGVLIWRYGTTAGARTTNSGVKHKYSGARASYKYTTELWL